MDEKRNGFAEFVNSHFPKCVGCGEPCMYVHGVSHPECAICSKCAKEELKRRSEAEPDGQNDHN